MRVLTIIAIACVIGIIVYGYLALNPKISDDKWNEKCRMSGGVVIQSGRTCEYANCDKSKYPCSFPY